MASWHLRLGTGGRASARSRYVRNRVQRYMHMQLCPLDNATLLYCICVHT